MVLWTVDDVMAALKDTAIKTHQVGPVPAVPLKDHGGGGVSIDTRTLKPGDVFVALKGPNTDGNLWARQALMLGASAVIVTRGAAPLPDLLSAGQGLVIEVPDTLAALEALARYGRDRTSARVIGVTGSFGKTTMKDTLLGLLSQKGIVTASQRSFNNHWGVPLTLCAIPAISDFAVVEMGMNHRGEIAHLSHLVRPNLAIITTIQAMHLENLGSIEGVCDAKTEII